MKFSKEILVGTVFFTALLVLITVTMIARADRFEPKQTIAVAFDAVGGLEDGAEVLVSGVKLGTVSKITLRAGSVFVEIAFREEVALYEKVKVRIDVPLALAKTRITIDPGKPDQNKPKMGRLNKDQMMRIEGVSPVNFLAKIDSILKDIEKGKGTLGRLFVDESLYDETLATISSVKRIIQGVEKGEGTAGKLLVDDTLHTEALAALTNIRKISDKANSKDGALNVLLGQEPGADLAASIKNIRTITGKIQTGDGLLHALLVDEALTGEVRQIVANINNVSTGLKKGEGTIGRLIKDPTLYEQISNLVKRLDNSIEDAREQAPITSFTSVLFSSLR